MTIEFDSKRDLWIVMAIWAGTALIVAAGISQLGSSAALPARLGLLALFFLAAAFMLWMLYGIRYVIEKERLLIRCGPFRYRVPLAAIDLVQPSKNPLSSPAASLDRLLIKWNGERKRVLISPDDKKAFLRELDKRCPQLVLSGDRLTRAET